MMKVIAVSVVATLAMLAGCYAGWVAVRLSQARRARRRRPLVQARGIDWQRVVNEIGRVHERS